MSIIKPDSTEDMSLRHLLWMCHNMPHKEDNPYKWNRWLGFIQGQMVAMRLMTIKQCKEANKRTLMFGRDECWRAIVVELRNIHALGTLSADSLMKRQEDAP